MYDFKALYEATSIENTLQLLQEHSDAKILAGGSDILIQIREGKFKDAELISIQKIDELRGVSMDSDGTLRIKPLTSFGHIEKDPLVCEHIPALAYAVNQIGGPQLRNIATIGGNICNGITSADSASTLMAYDAVMEYTGPNGTRLVSIQEHYVKAGVVAIQKGELLTSILISPESYQNYYGYFTKYAMREALDIATLGCSVNVKLSADKKSFEDVRIAYGVAGPVPMRASHAENTAKGQTISENIIEKISLDALDDANPRDSWRASKELREQVLVELTKRCLTNSTTNAGGAL